MKFNLNTNHENLLFIFLFFLLKKYIFLTCWLFIFFMIYMKLKK